tara:strand:- start:1811 stop:3022 length:1212 start_codon:yes stop_codon:yes gene_type:complete
MTTKSSDPLMLPDLPIDTRNKRALQQICWQLMRGEDSETFPGSQPVSFERRHLSAENPISIKSHEYMAAEKTDGVRYMLLVVAGRGAYMIDRNFEFKQLPTMHFPGRAKGSQLTGTLLDGELVLDQANGSDGEDAGPPKLRYLAYDACAVAGTTLVQSPLTRRLLWLRREVLAPRHSASAAGHDFSGELFAVEQKDFFGIPQLPHIFQHIRPGASHLYAFHDPLRRLQHGNDGIIFTPVADKYHPGTCQALLKWKPADMNTIDFRLRTVWGRESGVQAMTPRFQLLIARRGSLLSEHYDWVTFDEAQYERFKADTMADRRVVECVYDPDWITIEYPQGSDGHYDWEQPMPRRGGWRFERIREDKNLPNDERTVSSVELSAKDGVTQGELLHELGPMISPKPRA